MDTLVNPFKQASIGIAKGVSKIGGGLTIVSDSVVENAAKIFRTNGNNNNNNNRINIKLNKDTQTFSLIEDAQAENTKNIPLRVLLVIMDEVFDLKQKNMWFRSRFVSILKGVLRTFMGDSVNRYDFSFEKKNFSHLNLDVLQCLFNIGHQQIKLRKKSYDSSTNLHNSIHY